MPYPEIIRRDCVTAVLYTYQSAQRAPVVPWPMLAPHFARSPNCVGVNCGSFGAAVLHPNEFIPTMQRTLFVWVATRCLYVSDTLKLGRCLNVGRWAIGIY